ncbi:MAG: MFS transporter [Ilumatobacter sp.]|nr:MFS transporter [Ilumatobacter sp.]MDJ0767768.1 MFS transporter [Ilumatobacter sp.]
MTSRSRPRPAWLVLGLAILAAALTGPGQTIGVSVFIDHFVDDLGLSRSEVSGAYMVGTLVGASLLPFVGRFIDRRGVRVAQVAIGLAFGVALVNMSLVNGLVWLAVGFAGIRFLGQGSLSLAATVTVQIRFERRRGTAVGLFTTVSGGLMALVPVVLAVVIAAVGWRQAWLLAALVVVAVVVPMALFGLRDLPTGRRGSAEPAGSGHDRGAAMRTASFWMLAAVTGAAGMMSTAMNFHQIDLLGDAGLSETAAAALFVPQVLGSTIAGLAIGYVADRIGTRYLPAVSMVLLLGAQLLGAVAAPGVVALAYAVVLGAAGGAVRTAAITLQPTWFGTGHLGSIQGALTLFGVGASAIGPVVLTLVEESLGSYPPALVVLGAVPVAALLFALGPNRGPAAI